jgi:hypothetical protein
MNRLYEIDMNNSNNDYHNIIDLPDEIFLIIFKELNTIDVFLFIWECESTILID